MTENKQIRTKWGVAKLYDTNIHYVIPKIRKRSQFLHVLIWEDFYNCKKPKGYVIHHKNGDPLDNCILNLQLMRMSDHIKLHKMGVKRKAFSNKWKQKLSEATNTSGYFRVTKDNDKNAKQGFYWCYQYTDDAGKHKIRRKDIGELEKIVKSKGLLWRKF